MPYQSNAAISLLLQWPELPEVAFGAYLFQHSMWQYGWCRHSSPVTFFVLTVSKCLEQWGFYPKSSLLKRYNSDVLRNTHTHTHTRLTTPCPGLPGWAGARKVKPVWILLEHETVSGSGISWAICKSAPRSRQITMPAPHHSVFYRPDALPAAKPTASKHLRVMLRNSRMNIIEMWSS